MPTGSDQLQAKVISHQYKAYIARVTMSCCWLSQDVKIDPRNGIPFLPEAPGLKYLEKGAPISMAAHGGPWHLREAILSSNYATDDLNAADIVFVYDHCYYMRWLGQVCITGGPHADIPIFLPEPASSKAFC